MRLPHLPHLRRPALSWRRGHRPPATLLGVLAVGVGGVALLMLLLRPEGKVRLATDPLAAGDGPPYLLDSGDGTVLDLSSTLGDPIDVEDDLEGGGGVDDPPQVVLLTTTFPLAQPTSLLHRLHLLPPPPFHLTAIDSTQPASKDLACLVTRTSPAFPICPHSAENDRYISAQLLTTGTWEPHIAHLFTRALRTYTSRGGVGATVVDLGAHVGFYSLLGASLHASVVAVEPVWASVVRLHAAAKRFSASRHEPAAFSSSAFVSVENGDLEAGEENGDWGRGREGERLRESRIRVRAEEEEEKEETAGREEVRRRRDQTRTLEDEAWREKRGGERRRRRGGEGGGGGDGTAAPGAANITVLYHAISDSRHFVKLRHRPGNLGGTVVEFVGSQEAHGIRTRSPSSVVTALPLADLLPFVRSSTVVIKMDVEGWECRAILGGAPFFAARHVAYIFMEWSVMANNKHKYHSPCKQRDLSAMVSWLTSKGYQAYISKTGSALNPRRLDTWRIGDIFWRHRRAPRLRLD